METVQSLDRRVQRTRGALHAALETLLEEAPFEQLTIARVASEAGITRATFYQHYASLDALFVASLDALLEALARQIPDEDLRMPIENAQIMRHVLSVWSRHRRELRAFVENGSRRLLTERFEASVTLLLARTAEVNGLRPLCERDAAYTSSFLASVAIGVFERWARRGFRESPAAIEALVAQLVGPGAALLLATGKPA